MSDIERVFQMLDIIQGHPGYAVECYQCHRPMTDIFGSVLRSEHYMPGVGAVGDREGVRHDLPSIGMCPIAYYGGAA